MLLHWICLTSHYEWIAVLPLKVTCHVMYFGKDFHPVCSTEFEGGEAFDCATRAAKYFVLPGMWLHLAAPKHPSEMSSVPPGWGNGLWLLSLCAGNILSCCRDLVLVQYWPKSSPKRAVWWCHVPCHTCHSQTMTCVLKAITQSLLSPRWLPWWPGHCSSHCVTILSHQSSSEVCAFKHCSYRPVCKVIKYEWDNPKVL